MLPRLSSGGVLSHKVAWMAVSGGFLACFVLVTGCYELQPRLHVEISYALGKTSDQHSTYYRWTNGDFCWSLVCFGRVETGLARLHDLIRLPLDDDICDQEISRNAGSS